MKLSGLSGILFLIFVFSALSAAAQRETDHWYFGQKAGLHFAGNGNPNFLTDSKMKALEGCTAISDSLGNLLFYTAGDTVYNKFHQIMNNGYLLAGDQSATQSSVVVPDPYKPDFYYLFTVDELGNNTNGLRYSVINVAASNGAGSVIAKNIPLLSPVAEKITVVDDRHSRSNWIIVHGTGTANDAFYAYRLTPTGPGSPVISRVGLPMAGLYPNFNATGYMKASPDGQRLAVALPLQNKVELYRFNDSSGVVSAPIQLRQLEKAYGVEFNREGTRLYVSIERTAFQIEQFNLELADKDSVFLSRTTVGLGTGDFAGALQLARNGKIYHADVFSNRLSLLNFPDSLGAKTRFNRAFQALNPLSDPSARYNQQGMPNFNQSYFWLPSFKFRKRCFGDSTAFTLLTTRKFQSLTWNFDDPNSGAANTSSEHNPFHIFSQPGNYQVTLTVTLLNNKVRSVTIPVTILPLPELELGPERIICPNSTLTLRAPDNFVKFLWSTGSDTSFTVVSEPGTYWLMARSASGCWAMDSVKVVARTGPEIFKQKYLEICPGRSLKLRTSQPFESYDWERNRTDSTLTVNRAGWYKVSVPYDGCVFTDSVEVAYRSCPDDLMIPNIVTPNGDDQNETFFIRGLKPGQLQIQIFNRWGTRIYEEKAYKNDWPKANQTDGTYYYLLFDPETGQSYKGWIEVVH